jgi:peptidoglycan hydrolase-like protein with peptidoglycan-binding domain
LLPEDRPTFSFTENERFERELFSEPFYQPDPETAERQVFSEPYYRPEVQPTRPREMTLARGTQGSQVAGLQQRLQLHGFYSGQVDSIFGPRTERAVEAFQVARGLAVTGEVDRATWQALSAEPQQQAVATAAVLEKGARGSKVKTLQIRLGLKGYDPGPVDGVFGPRTLAAVSDFQQAAGLESTGVVDDKTWGLLGQEWSN